MRTRGLIRAASRAHEPDLWPVRRARLAEGRAGERVMLELPAFTWPWRLVAATAVAIPFFVPEPVRFLAASGLL